MLMNTVKSIYLSIYLYLSLSLSVCLSVSVSLVVILTRLFHSGVKAVVLEFWNRPEEGYKWKLELRPSDELKSEALRRPSVVGDSLKRREPVIPIWRTRVLLERESTANSATDDYANDGRSRTPLMEVRSVVHHSIWNVVDEAAVSASQFLHR